MRKTRIETYLVREVSCMEVVTKNKNDMRYKFANKNSMEIDYFCSTEQFLHVNILKTFYLLYIRTLNAKSDSPWIIHNSQHANLLS